MADISLILLAAGDSSRLNMPIKKQWIYIEDKPLWQFVADRFKSFYNFKEIIVVANEKELKLMQKFANFSFVAGGESRAESLKNALTKVNSKYVMVSDVARACVKKETILKLIKKREKKACVVPAIKLSDTIYYEKAPIDREKLLAIQTPQLSHTKTLKKILKRSLDFTDESSAFYKNSKKVIFIEGSKEANKITYKDDLKILTCLKPAIEQIKVGYGIDIHAFEDKKEMYLNGVKIESDFGFKAHSDGDVAIHSLIDALLGAAALGDIGELFPDTDDEYKNIDSKKLLLEVVNLLRGVGYEIVNVDMTILAEVPKIKPYKERMLKSISNILKISKQNINIKATRGEKLGFIGRKEGVTVQSVVTLKYYRWDEK